MMGIDTGISVLRPHLRGARVVVRRLNVDDVPELASLLADSADFHRPWVSYPSSGEALLGYLKRMDRGDGLLYAVSRLADQRLVGLISVSRIVYDAWHSCECGCCVGAAFRGHGYLTEAMALLVRHVFTDLGLHRVEALVDDRNIASQRMLTAVGFRPGASRVARCAPNAAGWTRRAGQSSLGMSRLPGLYNEGGEQMAETTRDTDGTLVDLTNVTLDSLMELDDSVLAHSLRRFQRESRDAADPIAAFGAFNQHSSSPW